MPKYTLQQFSDIRSLFDLSFSPDGQHIAYTSDASGQANVYRQPIYPDTSGKPQEPVQLTNFSEDVARRVFWNPSGGSILVLADHQGNENYQLYSVLAKPSAPLALTNDTSVRNEVGTPYSNNGEPFSPDGRFMAYSSNARDRSTFDVVARDLTSGETRTVFADTGRNFTMSWSPDGRYLLALRVLQNLDHRLYLCDVESGTARLLTPDEGEMRFYPGPWLPDSSGFYVMTNMGREFDGLAIFRLADNSIEWVETPDWDVAAAALSSDGRYLAWLVNNDGYSELHVRDKHSGEIHDYPDLPQGTYVNPKALAYTLRFSPTEPVLGLYVMTPRTPENLYLINVASGEIWPLTYNVAEEIAEEDMFMPELVRYSSDAGVEIAAWLYQPPGLPPGERSPVVVSIHGGPEAQELPIYNDFYQYLAQQGIGVLATNIRGSTGYGRTYQSLIYHDWGGGDLRDFEASAKYLQSLDWVDPARLGVYGGSYGGFATLTCITRLPQYWSAAVDIVGPSNLITFARAVPAHWRERMRRWVGDPETEADFLLERSPISYVENTRAALLVMQGVHDPRVVKAESDQLVARLRELDRTVEYMIFEDEGHGFTKKANSDRALFAAVAWFERHLLGEVQQ